MKSLFRRLRRFLADENGPAVVEYVVMLAMIVATLLMAISSLGRNSSGVYDNVSQSINDAGGDGAEGGEGR
ncbi:Flp family type IVb pilin [Planctomycetota bacterium]